ncbi:PTS system mannose/fructose/N-acetylgalactosamine-transporter subunit IIB [Candidatus Hodarchaeum mangrovi]
MAIVHVRIDDRLIHGQVGMAWIKRVKADTVFVVNDEVANNPMIAAMVPMGAPSGIMVKTLTIENAVNELKKPEWNDNNIMIICKYPEDALGLVEHDIKLPQVNLGNMSGQKDAYKIGRGIWVLPNQISTYEKLNELGIKLTAKMLPDDKSYELMNEISKMKK